MQEELIEAGMPEPMVKGTTREQEYKPSNREALKEYEVHIKFLDRGCIVNVGCKSIAFEDVKKAMDEINEYVTGDTYEVQKKWFKLFDM